MSRYTVNETDEGFELRRDNATIATYRNAGAAQAGRDVEARREEAKAKRIAELEGSVAGADRELASSSTFDFFGASTPGSRLHHLHRRVVDGEAELWNVAGAIVGSVGVVPGYGKCDVVAVTEGPTQLRDVLTVRRYFSDDTSSGLGSQSVFNVHRGEFYRSGNDVPSTIVAHWNTRKGVFPKC